VQKTKVHNTNKKGEKSVKKVRKSEEKVIESRLKIKNLKFTHFFEEKSLALIFNHTISCI
jgi:hypothetical protein